jgi:hypothetical protein
MFSIFGAAYNPATGKWRAFNEETLTILSEHATERAALSACRHYTECQIRRVSAQVTRRPTMRFALPDLAHQAT